MVITTGAAVIVTVVSAFLPLASTVVVFATFITITIVAIGALLIVTISAVILTG